MGINVMRRKLILAAAITLTASLSYADDGPDPASIAKQGLGDNIPACSSCHGADGGGNAAGGFPRLAGVGASYLEEQLNAVATGDRKSPVMMPIAKALSKDQRHALAVYYSQMPVPDGANAQNTSGESSDGARELAEHGRWADGIPACVQCHGPGGVGVGEHFPPLAGQPSSYIEDQLRAWRTGERPGGPMGLMASVATKLDDRDLSPIADYFAALPANPEQQAAAADNGGDHE